MLQSVRRRDYTDWAVVVGHSYREACETYEYLRRRRPEVLLGYRVLLTTVDLLKEGRGRGLMALKVVVQERAYEHRDARWQISQLGYADRFDIVVVST